MNDEVPHVLDATTCIFMKYISSGEHLFNNQPCTFTNCQEIFVHSADGVTSEFEL